MRCLVLAIVMSCGDGPGEQAIRGEPTLETFANRMCACRDSVCATQVVTEMARWAKRVKTPHADPASAKVLMARYNTCMTQAVDRSRTR